MPDLPIAVVGIDHHRTPIEVRERLAIPTERVEALLGELCRLPGCDEAVALSTCNRAEWYIGGAPDHERFISWLAERQGLPGEVIARHSYVLRGRDCVRHLFRVAASLESLVVGEYQIVHQMKSAYETAQRGRSTGPLLNPLFQRALAVAKEVRNSTAIGKHKLSIASVAVDLARHIHGDLATARLLVVGAGEIAELAVRYLIGGGVRTLSVINRSRERAQALATEHPQAAVLDWEQLGVALATHDIVVCSTAAPQAVITATTVRAALRGRRAPLMLIDLAVPRDVDDQVAKLDDVYLYNIDHLEQVVAANRSLRSEEVDAAAALVDAQVAAYAAESDHARSDLLAQVAAYFADVVAAEETRLAGKLAVKDKDREQLRYGLERVGNKLQHQLLRFLRAHTGDVAAEAAVREILGLDPTRSDRRPVTRPDPP